MQKKNILFNIFNSFKFSNKFIFIWISLFYLFLFNQQKSDVIRLQDKFEEEIQKTFNSNDKVNINKIEEKIFGKEINQLMILNQ